MGLVGISPQQATNLCDDLQTHTDTMRQQLGVIGTNVGDLQSHHYISDTMDAFQLKFESESKKQMTDVLNTATEAITGTREVIRVQLERQAGAGTEIKSV